ncbi:hypothetical protein [Fulvivirga lutimaris]|uniref:hypothetical protein n=1 Tax=Fulvivirga lutimaris TaxID=1819566 RepID=UPI0012BCC180|nr:hypothetical protein [Fulvivirga lutimaris]MTI40890.1 hypothetical protein [Fulvivirga lutimaris]
MDNHQIYFESATAKVYYDKDLDTLFLEYLKNVKNHADFLVINEALTKAFQGLNTNKLVADIRKIGIIALESQEYVANVMFPAMLKHLKGGQLHHAQYLDEKDVFAKISGGGVKSKAEKNKDATIIVEQFSDWDKLIDWLKSVN